ncbi:hypothetical protein B0H11DRAFT_1942737 [Mycena galericulata]|nr:hypothetical protein B0H11DRAFT_1942737 [Mycena galericulata]
MSTYDALIQVEKLMEQHVENIRAVSGCRPTRKSKSAPGLRRSCGARPLSCSPSPILPSAGDGKDKGKSAAAPDTLLRAQDLLAHYFPNTVEADERIKAESADASGNGAFDLALSSGSAPDNLFVSSP